MMQTMDCNEARISLGVYVLGAIDPAERALVDAHLATCQECRDELAELAGLPALLARVNKDEALGLGGDIPPPPAQPAPEPPPELLGTVLDLTAARRRRKAWRNTLTAAAAAVIVAAGAFTGTHYLSSSSSPPPAASGHDPGAPMGPWEQSTATNSSGQAATIAYQQMGWGMQLDTKVVGIPVNTTCQLYVITKDGAHHFVSSWTTDTAENNVWYGAGTSVNDSQVKSFEITTGKTPPVYLTPSS